MVVLTPALVSFAGAVRAAMATSRTSAANTVIARFVERLIEMRDIFFPPGNVFAPRTCLDAGVSAAKAKSKMFLEKTRESNIAKKKSGSEHCSCESGHCARRANGRKNPHIRILVRRRVSKCFTMLHRV